MSVSRRSLHFVFKVADRTSAISFYRNVLGMKVLRHEEFEEGCKATCNGPYDGKWSKTMIGYGEEHSHFVLELTYNYGIKNYNLGNDYQWMSIYSKMAYSNALKVESHKKESDDSIIVGSPGGYNFKLYNREPQGKDPVQGVCLSVSGLQQSLEYWNGILGMNLYSHTNETAVLGYEDTQAKLILKQIPGAVNHEEAFGRIAFSCSSVELPEIERTINDKGYKILSPLVSLDTPGKATVQVIILADPDGHEICFVGDEAFQELSVLDLKANTLLDQAINNDDSAAWFEARAKQKAKHQASEH